MINTLLVDYAGVLTPTRNNFLFVKQFYEEYGVSPKELMNLTYLDWDKTAIGELDSKSYWERVAKVLEADPEMLRKRVLNTYPIDKRMIDFLKKIKKQYTLVLISNQIYDWLEEVINKNDLRSIFDYTANSYEVGVRKPDPKIFKYALNLTKSMPEETLFIDDSLKNINAAKNLGMQTIRFSNFVKFSKEINILLKTV